jgi:cytochrome c553
MMSDPHDPFQVTRTKIIVVGTLVSLALAGLVLWFAPARNLQGVTTRPLHSSTPNLVAGDSAQLPPKESPPSGVDMIPTKSPLDEVPVDALYQKFCAMCHGADGTGNEQMNRMSKTPITSLAKGPFKLPRTPEAVTELIMKGSGVMPGFEKELGRFNATRLANYALTLESK